MPINLCLVLLLLFYFQRMNALLINFSAAMDVAYQKDGNVIRRKIVVMEAMKLQAIVVSLLYLLYAHSVLHFILLFSVCRIIELNA